jgi:hypothetical protein
MPGWKRLSALLAVAAVATAATGCGSNEINGTIPTDQAAVLNDDLDAVQNAVAADRCAEATAAADRFVATVNSLPADAGIELKTALRDAGTNLKTLAACEPSGATGAAGAQREPTTTDTTSSTTSTTTPATTPAPETPAPSPSGNNGGGGNQGSPPSNQGGNDQGSGGGASQGNGNPGGGSSGGTGGTGGTGVGSG